MMRTAPATLAAANKQHVSAGPLHPVVETLHRAGQSLDPVTRRDMESRFQHDFSQVRVHSGPGAAEAADVVGANAFTWNDHVVFNTSRYAPHTREGQHLLAHELAHVVQQRAPASRPDVAEVERDARSAADDVMAGEAATVIAGAERGAILRQGGAGEELDRRFRLRMPQLGESLGRQRQLSLGDQSQYQLRLDPAIQAQIRAIQFVRGQLSLESLELGVSQISSSLTTPAPATAPNLSPRAAAQSAVAQQTQPNPFSVPPTPQRRPLVPAGRGPATPRAGTVGDVLRATLRIPAVQTAVTRLRNEAGRQVRQSWRQLSAGERALVITQGIVIGAGALTGIAVSPEARQFALQQVQGRDIPIPGLPVTFQFNLTGRDQRLTIGVNVGALLPRSLGFR